MRRLTPARLSLMMFGVVGLLIAAYVVKGLLATEAPAPQAQTRNVPMAIADLVPGTVITEAHLALGPVATRDLQPDVVLNNRVLVGRVVREPISAATAIRSNQLYPPGERPPLEIAEDMRAVSIPLGDSVAVVDGLVRAGHFVDVHMTPTSMDNDERLGGGMTFTLFKGVKLLALNRNARTGGVSAAGNTVTLELTPQQANVVLLAQQRGTLALTYNPQGRGTGELEVRGQERATLEEILNLPPVPEPVSPEVTEHYRGLSRREAQFRDGRLINPGPLGGGDPRGSAGGRSANRTRDRSGSGDSGRDDSRGNGPDDRSFDVDRSDDAGRGLEL